MQATLQIILNDVLQKKEISCEMVSEFVKQIPSQLLDVLALSRIATSFAEVAPFTCGIINAKSGRCKDNCKFCAQSRYYSSDAQIYPLVSLDTLVRQAEAFARSNVHYMGIVTSGTAPSKRDFALLCHAAQYISERVDIKLCASFGLLNQEQARKLYQSGFRSYHHNLETSRSFYPLVCDTHSYELRIETVKCVKIAGLRVCSGGIFGLGESWMERIELAETLRKLDVDSIPVNFLMPAKGTPLENTPPLVPEEALGTIALMRLMNPSKDIVICGGRHKVLNNWENFVFSAGANGIMIGDYLTKKGNAKDADFQMLQTLGLR